MTTKKRRAPRRRTDTTPRPPYANTPGNEVLVDLTRLFGKGTSRDAAAALNIPFRRYLAMASGRRRVTPALLLTLSQRMQFLGFHVGERAAVAAAMLDLASRKRYASLLPAHVAKNYELDIQELRALELWKLLGAIDVARKAGLIHV